MIRKVLLILLILSLLILYLALEVNRKRQFNWEYNFSGVSKQPFGCFVLRDVLEKDRNLPIRLSFNKSFYEFLKDGQTRENTTILIVTEDFDPDSLELSTLYDYVYSGNQVFLSAYNFGKRLCDSLRFQTNLNIAYISEPKDSVNLINPFLKSSKSVAYNKCETRNFTKIDTVYHEVLGYGRMGQANYIRIKYGKGVFYVHTQPMAFTNFHMLYNNQHYPLQVLSYLKGTKLLWDDYYKPPAGQIAQYAETPFRYLLSEDALRTALYLSLILMFVWFLIESKRKQRAIPIFEPPVNATVNFVKTIARLYQGNPDYKKMGIRKFQFFKEMIFTKYNMRISEQDNQAAFYFSERTGYDVEKMKSILGLYQKIESSKSIDADMLILFSKMIDDVYIFESGYNFKNKI